MALWEENERFFESFAEDRRAVEDVAFIANDLGADVELDAQGRLLLPSEMRRLLGLEGQPVWLDCFRGRLNIYSKTVYEQRKQRAIEGLPEKLATLERSGLR